MVIKGAEHIKPRKGGWFEASSTFLHPKDKKIVHQAKRHTLAALGIRCKSSPADKTATCPYGTRTATGICTNKSTPPCPILRSNICCAFCSLQKTCKYATKR